MPKKTRDFLKNKFKNSFKKDFLFWLSTLIGVGLMGFTYHRQRFMWQGGFMQFIRSYWGIFGLWVGFAFLVTRNYDDSDDFVAQQIKSFVRVLLLAVMWVMPMAGLVIIPILILWMVIETNRRPTPENDQMVETKENPSVEIKQAPSVEIKKAPSKLAITSLVCSGLALPLLFGITMLQEFLMSSGILHRQDVWADAGIGFWVGVILATIGIVMWAISRRQEGRNAWNFWAMRLIVVNVILSPFALLFMLAIAIGRSK